MTLAQQMNAFGTEHPNLNFIGGLTDSGEGSR